MRRFLIYIILLTAVNQQCLAAADTLSLNGLWKFKTDLYKIGEQEQWFKSSIPKENWDSMEVPSNWDLKNEYADYKGDAWYSYAFKGDDSWNSKHVRLVFQSVYNDAEVWLNGNKLGENHFGFLQFYFDVSKYLLIGENNEIVVKVNNVFKKGAIWNWGGIRRPVWLEITNPIRINSLAITAKPDLQKQNSTVNIKAEVANYATKSSVLSLGVEIFYNNKSIYNSGIQKSVSIKENETTIIAHEINLSKTNTHLWHFEHPELYTAKLAIYENKELLHTYQDRFGIRKIEIDGLKLRLNGEEIRPVGFNLVPEDRVTGNTLPLDRIKKLVDMMKESGANMARMSHMSLPKEFLDYLDQKGIMIFEEVTLWGKDVLVDPNNPLPKLWLEKLIKQEYNHPSIIGWSVGNEIGSLKNNPFANEYIKGAIENAKRLDPNRLAVYVSNSVPGQANDASQYSDLIMLNSYGGWANAAQKAHNFFPNKPIFFTEFGENLNSEDPNDLPLDFDRMLKGIRGKDYIIGASLWTFNDYRSNYWSVKKTWETLPSDNRTWGVVNTFLQKKSSYRAIQKTYLPFKILKLNHTINNSKAQGSITLNINDKLGFPAYKMEGYSINVKALNGSILENQSNVNLPTLNSGDGIKNFDFQVPISSASTALKISILDPQSYARIDTTIYLKNPEAVKLLSVHTGLTNARIIFEPTSASSSYTLKYGLNDFDQESEPTINSFVELKDLKENSTYKYKIVAHNNMGTKESVEAKFTLDEDELPPIIWGVEPVKNGFFISYSGDPLDYRYEVQYGEISGNYKKLLTFNTNGVLQVPNLESGKQYFFRLRRIVQWGFASEWTHEVQVKTL